MNGEEEEAINNIGLKSIRVCPQIYDFIYQADNFQKYTDIYQKFRIDKYGNGRWYQGLDEKQVEIISKVK